MKIFDTLYDSHLTNLSRSLGRTSERQSLLANNLANLNTPGYKRKDIDFAIALDEAGSGLKLRGPSQIASQNGSMRLDGNSVNLEQEVVAIAETEARYKLLADMTNRYFTGLKSVIREGR